MRYVTSTVWVAFVILLGVIGLWSPALGEVSLTIYHGDLALVRETRLFQFHPGVNEIEVANIPPKIDPTSVQLRSLTAPEGLSVLEQRYRYGPAGFDQILRRYRGQQVRILTEDGPYTGTLLSYSGEGAVLAGPGGRVILIRGQAIRGVELPGLADGVEVSPALTWLVKSRKEGKHEVEISYLTSGIGWQAEYVATVGAREESLQLSGWVSIANRSGVDYPKAELKLVAGEIHRVRELPPVRYGRARAEAAPLAPEVEEKPLFEYHLYTLKRRLTLKDNQSRQVPLFPEVRIGARRIFSYDGQRDGTRVRVRMVFENSSEKGLGLPLPGGKVRLYKQGQGESWEFLGEDRIGHIPQGEQVRLWVGDAFDIVGQRTVKERKAIGDRMRDEVVEIRLANHKDADVGVMVIEQLRGDWEILESSQPFRQKDAYTIEFDVPVAKGEESKVEYRVRYRW